MPSKSQMLTVAYTLAALWAIHNVGALSPVKEFMNLK